MKALEILKKVKEGNFTPCLDESLIKIDEAIEEIEVYKTNYQDVKQRLGSTVTTLTLLTSANKSMSKILIKMNEEMISLRKENQELIKSKQVDRERLDKEIRVCSNCKYNVGV